MSTLRCCVLGATGFIGGQIARAALARGWAVRGIRRQPGAVGALADIADRIEWVEADLADPASLVLALRGCPLVYHAAAYYPQRSPEVWSAVRHGVIQMRNFLAAAATAGARRVVYTSSVSTVGPPTDPARLADENDLYVPGSVGLPYFEVKWAMEQEAMRAAADGLPVVTVLPTAVIGPGDGRPGTSRLLLLVARRRLRWTVAGTVNVVDGRDLAMGHVLAAERGVPGKRYILGGHNLSFGDMLTAMAEAAGVPPPRRALPAGLVQGVGRVGARLGVAVARQMRTIGHWQPVDTSHTRQALELPEPRPFADTCQDALDWYRENGYLKRRPAG